MHKAVVFDFFGVISSEVAPFWLRDHFSEQEALDIKSSIVAAADRGEISQQDLFHRLAALAHVSAADVESAWLALAHLDDDMVGLVRLLATQTRLGLLTNAPAPFVRRLLADGDLEPVFAAIVVSSEHGVAKPDPRAYLQVLSELGVIPSRSLLVDDNATNVVGAQSVGMNGLLFTSFQETAQRISEFLR